MRRMHTTKLDPQPTFSRALGIHMRQASYLTASALATYSKLSLTRYSCVVTQPQLLTSAAFPPQTFQTLIVASGLQRRMRGTYHRPWQPYCHGGGASAHASSTRMMYIRRKPNPTTKHHTYIASV
ncbi:hypothetical protein ACJBU6_00042 [Exserohilum turcicum]